MINDFAINKLILLYILTRINAPIDNSDLVEFMIQNEYSDYFNIQQYMSDLLKSKFVYKINQDRKSLYMITPEGSNALQYFMNRIPKDYLDIMDVFCAKYMSEVSDVALYDSVYSEYEKDKYQINCFITRDGIEIVNIKLSDLSKDKVTDISKKWKDNGKEMYNYIKNKMGI